MSITRAFVLGAGLGTRLGVLTQALPKPLIPICQKPLISFAFDHLTGNGIREFVVNTHHCAEAYSEAFPDASYRGCPIAFRHEPVLLETAGGIKNAEDLLRDEAFVVYNGDILSDLPLAEALSVHREAGNEVTLVLRSSGGPLQVAFDQQSGRVLDIGRRRAQTGVPIEAPHYLFTGIYIVEPAFLARIPAGRKLSVVPVFMEMIGRGERLGAAVVDSGHWWDLGTRESYLEVHRFLHEGGHFGAEPGWPVWVHPQAHVDKGACLLGATAVGGGARIGAGAELTDCVVWKNAIIAGGSRLQNCIVTAGRQLGGTHNNYDV